MYEGDFALDPLASSSIPSTTTSSEEIPAWGIAMFVLSAIVIVALMVIQVQLFRMFRKKLVEEKTVEIA